MAQRESDEDGMTTAQVIVEVVQPGVDSMEYLSDQEVLYMIANADKLLAEFGARITTIHYKGKLKEGIRRDERGQYGPL